VVTLAPPATPNPVAPPALGTASGRVPPYVPAPVIVNFALGANGSWFEPGPVTVTFALGANGSWYEPAPVTVTFGLSATGSWIERTESPARPLQPAPTGP